MSARFEVLPGFPPYGGEEITNINGQPSFSEGYVVKFFRDDGSYWIANFKRGVGSFDKVYEYPQALLVFAGGEAYVMDPNKKEPLENFGWGFDVLEVDGRLACIESTHILVVESDFSRWEIGDITLDFFKQLHVKEGRVEGLAYNYLMQEDVPFALDLQSRAITYPNNEETLRIGAS